MTNMQIHATIDSYAQMNILLTRKHARQLKRKGSLEAKVWRTTGEELPLKLLVVDSEDKWRAQGIPEDKPYEEKQAYEIDIPKYAVNRLIRGHELSVGNFMSNISLRAVYFTLEDSYSVSRK